MPLDELQNSIHENNFNIKFRLFEINEKLFSSSSDELTGQLEIARHSLNTTDEKLKELKTILNAPDVKPLDEVEKNYKQIQVELRQKLAKSDDINTTNTHTNTTSSSIHSLFEGISPIKSPMTVSKPVTVSVPNLLPPRVPLPAPVTRLDLDNDPFSSDSERIETLPLIRPGQVNGKEKERVEDVQKQKVESEDVQKQKVESEDVQKQKVERADVQQKLDREDVQDVQKQKVSTHANEIQRQTHSDPPSIKNIILDLSKKLSSLSQSEIIEKLQNYLSLERETPSITELQDKISALTKYTQSLQQQLQSPPADITTTQELYIRRYDSERLRDARGDLKFMLSFQARQLATYKQASRRRLELLQASGAIQIHDTTILDDDEFEQDLGRHRPSLLAVFLTILSAIRLRNRLMSSRKKLYELRIKVKEA